MERIDELILSLISLDLYAEAEILYFNKIFKNTHLPVERRHEAVLSILNFPSFYKPKLQLTGALLREVIQILPQSPNNGWLVDLYLAQFDKKPKFSFYEMKLEEMAKFKEEASEFT